MAEVEAGSIIGVSLPANPAVEKAGMWIDEERAAQVRHVAEAVGASVLDEATRRAEAQAFQTLSKPPKPQVDPQHSPALAEVEQTPDQRLATALGRWGISDERERRRRLTRRVQQGIEPYSPVKWVTRQYLPGYER